MVFFLPKKRIDVLSILFLFCIIGISTFLLLTVGSSMLLSSILAETQSFTSYTKSFEVVNTVLLSSAFFFLSAVSIGFYIFWRMPAMQLAETPTQRNSRGKGSSVFGTIFYISLALLIVWGFFSLPKYLLSTHVEAKETPVQVFLLKTPLKAI